MFVFVFVFVIAAHILYWTGFCVCVCVWLPGCLPVWRQQWVGGCEGISILWGFAHRCPHFISERFLTAFTASG